MTVTAAAETDIGRVRRKNQDTFGLDPEHQVYIVCDGMGGAAGGEIASRIAVDTFLDTFRSDVAARPSSARPATHSAAVELSKNALFHATLAANDAVYKRATIEPSLQGMGSTLVGAHVEDNRLLLVNVGDSRAYLVRDGECSQLTVDHSYLEEQVRLGLMTQAMADASMLHSVITRAIGIEDGLVPDLFGVDLEDGDLALLTSDGLTRHVLDTEIARILSPETPEGELPTEPPSLSARCDQLIALAKKRGGSDNITCVLLHFTIA